VACVKYTKGQVANIHTSNNIISVFWRLKYQPSQINHNPIEHFIAKYSQNGNQIKLIGSEYSFTVSANGKSLRDNRHGTIFYLKKIAVSGKK